MAGKMLISCKKSWKVRVFDPCRRLLKLSLVVFFVVGLYPLLGAEQLQPQALEFTGTCMLRQIEPQLTGRGVTVGAICRSMTYIDTEPQNDYRPYTSHRCFAGKNVSFFDDGWIEAGFSGHSTAISSILIGSDPNAFYSPLGRFEYEGIVPQADLYVYEFWYFVTDYVFPNRWPQVDVLTMSVGSAFEDWWTRGIDSMAERFGLVIVAGIGNGRKAFDPPLYPAAGANVIAVGVVDSNDANGFVSSLANFTVPDPDHSSAGPTSDGRCKPDIVAPGNCLAAIVGTQDGYYATGDYSSFAAPVVAGIAGLLIQKAKSDPNLWPVLSPMAGNCLIKSILMTSARKLPGWHKGYSTDSDDYQHPLDFRQGAGLVDALAAYNVLMGGMQLPGEVNAIGWDNNILDPNTGGEEVYEFDVNDVGGVLAATLVWNKVYEDRYPFKPVARRNADLKLELWGLELNDMGDYVLLDRSDSAVDNVEHLYTLLDGRYGKYELVVSFSTESPTASVPYAISWKPAVPESVDDMHYE